MHILTPVVLLIFNRPYTTKQVFEKIRQARPRTLLIIADGPRTSEEAPKCHEARKIAEAVDWNCDVLKNFSEQNLGCGRRVSTGLDWVFSIVEEAIILEDDCLPASSFFNFCQVLLRQYRYDKRIMHISGNNFQFGQSRSQHSYYFSKYSHIWGWATWRRAWHYFDYNMKSWPEFKKMNMIEAACEERNEQLRWTNLFEKAYIGLIDTWDFQWQYACWSQNGLSILPEVNLVSNIGFNSDATHTSEMNNPCAILPTSNIWDIRHPPLVVRNSMADKHTFDYIFDRIYMSRAYAYANRLRKILSKLKRNMKYGWLAR